MTLYGYALDGDEVCLVYQFMPNGSLDDCLHQKVCMIKKITWMIEEHCGSLVEFLT